MNITLYYTDSPVNAINKSLVRVNGTTGYIRDQAFDPAEFDIRLDQTTFTVPASLPMVNYVYIDEFARYYFAQPLAPDAVSTFIYHLKSDPLMSFKTQILASKILPNRVQAGNTYVLDELVRTQTNRAIEYMQFPQTPFLAQTPLIIVQGPNGTFDPT